MRPEPSGPPDDEEAETPVPADRAAPSRLPGGGPAAGGAAAPKEPVIALLLSLCLPGAGYAYAERPLSFLRVVLVTGFLYFLAATSGSPVWIPVALHVFNAVASAGAVRERNRRLGLDVGAAPPPPPPASRRPAEEPPHSEPRPSALLETGPALPPIGPDEFLADLHGAWDEYRAGTIDAGAFAARKAHAIRRLRFDDEDDRAAVVEAAAALVDGGILTPGERSRIESKGTHR